MRVFLLLATLAAAAAAPDIGRASEAGSLKDRTPHVVVTAPASVEVVPDLATIRLGVVTERKTATDAAAENARAAQVLVDEVRAQGIEAKDVRTVAVTLAPIYDEERDPSGRVTKRTLRGYAARNSLTVRVRQVDRAGALARRLIDRGANAFDGVTFEVSEEERERHLDALRARAAREAERRAKVYAEALGLALGRVLVLEPESDLPSPPFEADMPRRAALAAPAEAASAAIPVEPGIQTLTTRVTVTWALSP